MEAPIKPTTLAVTPTEIKICKYVQGAIER